MTLREYSVLPKLVANISVGDINALTAAPADCGIIANAALAISTFARNGNNPINNFYGLI